MTASAQTDVKVTLLDSLPVSKIQNYAKATNRTAYGYNDRLYLNDRATQQLRVFNFATNEEIGQVDIGENQSTGYDEAGNAIVGNWGFGGSNNAGKTTTFTLISADLKKTVTTNEVKCVQGRADFLGRAKGNVFGPSGAVLLANGAAQNLEDDGIVAFTFTGGDNPTVEYGNVWDPDNKIGAGSWATYNYYKAADGTDHYVYVNRQYPLTDFTFEDGQVSTEQLYSPEDRTPNKGVCNGGDIFVLGSHKFIVYGNNSTPTYLDGFTIAEIGSDNTLTTVYTKAANTSFARELTTQGNWLNVEVLNDKQAKLYQYFVGGYAAEYGIAIDGAETPVVTGVKGIENTAAKAVSTMYYTPAGVANKTAVKGLNIVVTKYADGTQKVVKVIK